MPRSVSFAPLTASRARGAWSPAYPKVLAFGDSITYGTGSTDGGGYRSKLQALAYSDGVPLNFVGSVQAGPASVSGLPFITNNEGHPGWTIAGPYPGTPTAGLTTITPSPALDSNPDIVLLLIGVNDLNYTAGLSTLLTRLTTLMQAIFTQLPRCKLIVAQNTQGNFVSPPEWTAYVTGIPALAATFAGSGYICKSVDMSTFPWSTADFSDGVHPNDSGYSKMAAIWYAAIRSVL